MIVPWVLTPITSGGSPHARSAAAIAAWLIASRTGVLYGLARRMHHDLDVVEAVGADAGLLHQALQIGDRSVAAAIDGGEHGRQFGRHRGHICLQNNH